MSANGNLGATSLKRRRRREDPMREYDQLSPELRAWVSAAVLPWRPRSVQRAFDRCLARTKDRDAALEELDRLQNQRLIEDTRQIWGKDHPSATVGSGA